MRVAVALLFAVTICAVCAAQEALHSDFATDIGLRGTSRSPFPRNDDSPDILDLPMLPDDEVPVRRFKKQALQSLSVNGGWQLATQENDLSISFLEASLSLGVPLGSFDNILGVTPSFRVDWVDSAPGLDVPPELYNTGVQFFWRKPLNDRWSAMGIVGPAIRSDFTTSDDALRVFALGLLSYDWVPDELSLSFGAVYLDRADIPLLPALGLQWAPQPSTRLDLQFPESRISHRLVKHGADDETWAYLAGGLGGNTWAVTRESGQSDELSLRDLRFVAGVEQVLDGGSGWLVEVGYAFNRRLEYESTPGEIPLSDGVLLEAGWAY